MWCDRNIIYTMVELEKNFSMQWGSSPASDAKDASLRLLKSFTPHKWIFSTLQFQRLFLHPGVLSHTYISFFYSISYRCRKYALLWHRSATWDVMHLSSEQSLCMPPLLNHISISLLWLLYLVTDEPIFYSNHQLIKKCDTRSKCAFNCNTHKLILQWLGNLGLLIYLIAHCR